jgi:hypothetical protein
MKKMIFFLLIPVIVFGKDATRVDSLKFYNASEAIVTTESDVNVTFENDVTMDSTFTVIDSGLVVTSGTITYIADTTITANAGAVAISDSLKVGAGVYIRKFFISAGGDSIGAIYYNTTSSSLDTVYMTQ